MVTDGVCEGVAWKIVDSLYVASFGMYHHA